MSRYFIKYAETFITLLKTEVEGKDNLLTFYMRVLKGLFYPTTNKG